MHIEIKQGSAATEKSGTSTKSGKPYSIRTQEAWAVFASGEVRKVKLPLNREQAAYPPGVYDLDLDNSLALNGYGEFQIGRVQLAPRKAAIVQGPARQAG